MMHNFRSFFFVLIAIATIENCTALCNERKSEKSSYSQVGFDTETPSGDTAEFSWAAFFTKPQAAFFNDHDDVSDRKCDTFYQGGWDYMTLDDFVVNNGMPPLDGLEFALRARVEAGGADNWCFNTMFFQQTIFFGSVSDFNFYYNTEYSNEDGSPICIQDQDDETLEVWWNVKCPLPGTDDTDVTTYTGCTMEQLDDEPAEIGAMYDA
eukprot:CAMPEP_0113936488 /NCGR_PEP_ID=MMETSP1339-20121228/3394_1 /TAXON_ID=94617 /ORGANISM="Fibrocapsa japonica" /LENGTH=208 /DNA_ID=CAMNT_0000938985 /DNA_START=76 /DNA_END=702 /DNA_ORIENTATION=- /assembly_acc=CAM_ASM_000762